MAILFSKQKKNIQYLLIGLGVLVIVLFLLWLFVWREPETNIKGSAIDHSQIRIEKIKINFDEVQDNFIQAFTPYEFVAPLSSGFGRDNPFATNTEPVSTSTIETTTINILTF